MGRGASENQSPTDILYGQYARGTCKTLRYGGVEHYRGSQLFKIELPADMHYAKGQLLAIQYPDGFSYPAACVIYLHDGKLHREDGPAVVSADGHREWFQHGERHNLDGPVVIGADGIRQWSHDRKAYFTEEMWNRAKQGLA